MFYKLFLCLLILLIFLLFFFYGNTIESELNLNFNYDHLTHKNKRLQIDQVNDYIAFQEDHTPYLNPNKRKEVVWFDGIKKTPYVIYFIHGFNGSKNEGKEICLTLSNHLKSNLLLTRLPGNGVYNKERSYQNITFYDHFRTVYDDLILSSLLGDEIILIGSSTGCTYSIIAAIQFPSFNIKKTIFFAPNMGLHVLPSLASELLASGYGKGIIDLATNKFTLDDKVTHPSIFISLIGSLKAFNRVKHKFKKDFIIFISEDDEWVSNSQVNFFFVRNKSKIKHYYILKRAKAHRILKLGLNSVFMKKIITFLNTSNPDSIKEMI